MSRRWTAADIPDQTGRRAVVTGATSGLGFHTALELARRGAAVTLAVRDTTRGAAAAEVIAKESLGAAVEVCPLDLANLASVRAFAEGWTGPLDLLVNNAGVMALPPQRTFDGFEMQFGTNHLGHFALTGLSFPSLLRSSEPRVVTISSVAHRTARIDLTDLQSEHGYGRWRAYGASKLANLLFAFELQRRVDAAGLRLLSVAAHPGYASTNLQTAGPKAQGKRFEEAFMRIGNALLGQSAARGARPQLYAATMPDVQGGEYFGPSGPMESRGSPTRVRTSPVARDEALAERLWEESEDLTGVHFEGLRRDH